MEKDSPLSLLRKSKYAFFHLLSFAFNRSEAKLILSRLCKRGKELCSDNYLDNFKDGIYSMEIRLKEQLQILQKFNQSYNFDDRVKLDLFMDFKRLDNAYIKQLVDEIGASKSIIELNVGGSPNPVFSESLFKALQDNHQIKDFSFETENLFYQEVQALAEMLSQNQSLRKLCLRRFKLNNSDVEVLVSGMSNNKEKLLSSVEFHDLELETEGLNAFFAYLEMAQPERLQNLTFSFIQRIGDMKRFVKMLLANKHIKRIKMINITLGDQCGEIIKALSENPNFEELILCGVELNEAFFQYLSDLIHNTKLNKIVLDSCTTSSIVKNYQLEKIGLAIEQSSHLKYIDLQYCSAIANLDIIFSQIQTNSSLQYLNLNYCKQEFLSLPRIITNVTSLKEVIISGNFQPRYKCNFLNDLCEALCKNKGLILFEMLHTQVPSSFYQFLKVNTTLREVKLMPTPDQINMLAQLLEETSGLKVFDMPNVRLSDDNQRQLQNVKKVRVFFNTERT